MEGNSWEHDSEVGTKANSPGKPIWIMAFEGKSLFGMKDIDRVVCPNTTGLSTVTKFTVTETPSRSGVGFKLV